MIYTLFSVMLLMSLADGPKCQEPSPTPVERHGRLRVAGTQIVDKHDEPVVLRGMSLYWSQWGNEFYTPQVVRWLVEDWRCNIIRVPIAVHHNGYLAEPDREMQKLRTVIDAAIGLGIYVIIDWHAHEPEPEAASAFFAEVAEHYYRHANIIYEVWNEPLDRHDWATVIKPYHNRLIATIRAHDPDNLIVLGTQTWSQDVDKAATDPVAGTNLAYTLHFYAGSHGQTLRDKADAALKHGIALFVTEWGTSMANGDDGVFNDETLAWWEYLDRHEISWCNWSIIDNDESSAALEKGASPQGGWTLEQISPSGRLVREKLRTDNPVSNSDE